MASSGGSLEILKTTYKQVIDDVVKNMKEEYLNEGADPEMLEELKILWLTKLNQSGAVARPARAEPPPRPSPAHSQLPELANVVPQLPTAPSKVMAGAPPSSSSSLSSGAVASGSSPGSHQQRATTSGSIGKTMLHSPSRPPPALLHIPSTAETSAAAPHQSRVQADTATSSVIQQAPPRTQQATPTTTTESATAATAQLAATPIATPSVMFHPSVLAAAALQQQANQSASSNPSILTSSAPSVMEALQQQLALGRGVSAAASGVTATPAVNPFGAALNLMNPAAGGMVPIQTAQGTMLIPLQAYLTLQQQLAAAAVASASGGETSSKEAESGNSEVHQIDGLPPVLQNSNRPTIQQGVEGSSDMRQIDETLSVLTTGASASCQEGGRKGENSGVVYCSDAALSIPCGDTFMTNDLPLSSSSDGDTKKHRKFETNDLELGLASAVSTVGGQRVSLLESQVTHSKCKSGLALESECDNVSLPNLKKSKSPSHKKKFGKAIFPNAKVIVQLDGPISGGGQGSKLIVQVDGNGSSSEEDSDADDDSSEDEENAAGVAGGVADENDEDPLNSEDDVSDANSDNEGGDFETEDTIVCQWEKVYRVKNKWKFQLKDGVMHVGGFDYVFHKTNGEADW